MWVVQIVFDFCPCVLCTFLHFVLQRVLTAEFIDGCKVSDKEQIQAMGLSLQDVSIVSLYQCEANTGV